MKKAKQHDTEGAYPKRTIIDTTMPHLSRTLPTCLNRWINMSRVVCTSTIYQHVDRHCKRCCLASVVFVYRFVSRNRESRGVAVDSKGDSAVDP